MKPQIPGPHPPNGLNPYHRPFLKYPNSSVSFYKMRPETLDLCYGLSLGSIRSWRAVGTKPRPYRERSIHNQTNNFDETVWMGTCRPTGWHLTLPHLRYLPPIFR